MGALGIGYPGVARGCRIRTGRSGRPGWSPCLLTSFALTPSWLAVRAGVSFVFQQAVNANLRAEIGSPWWAGFISYLGGSIVMFAVAMALGEPWPSLPTIVRSH